MESKRKVKKVLYNEKRTRDYMLHVIKESACTKYHNNADNELTNCNTSKPRRTRQIEKALLRHAMHDLNSVGFIDKFLVAVSNYKLVIDVMYGVINDGESAEIKDEFIINSSIFDNKKKRYKVFGSLEENDEVY